MRLEGNSGWAGVTHLLQRTEVKFAILNSRNASQEIPDDGSPRRLIAELDKAHKAMEVLQREHRKLAAELATAHLANQELREQLEVALSRRKKS